MFDVYSVRILTILFYFLDAFYSVMRATNLSVFYYYSQVSPSIN